MFVFIRAIMVMHMGVRIKGVVIAMVMVNSKQLEGKGGAWTRADQPMRSGRGRRIRITLRVAVMAIRV
jgi:hypothetical protein